MVSTVLIVDDHPDFRRNARALLEADGFEVVGEAVDGASAIAEAGNRPKIVLTSSRNASSYRRRLQHSPGLGFIPKSELSGEALASFLA
jgi:DNA-binding NarL/FixJ family response regulator